MERSRAIQLRLFKRPTKLPRVTSAKTIATNPFKTKSDECQSHMTDAATIFRQRRRKRRQLLLMFAIIFSIMFAWNQFYRPAIVGQSRWELKTRDGLKALDDRD